MDPQQNQLKQIEFLICLHLQATCDKDIQLKPCQQIIQLSAIAISVKKPEAELIGKFHQFAKPQCNPKLTQFCTGITGITSAQLKEAKNIENVVEQLGKWIQNIEGLKMDNFTFVTWGSWTIKSGMLTELKVKKLKVPDYVHSYTDLKRTYGYLFNQNLGAVEAANQLQIDLKQKQNQTKSEFTVQAIYKVVQFLYNNKKLKLNRKIITIVNDIPNVNVTSELQYLLVLDFEATCQDNVKLKPCSEIIQFPVMVVSLKEGKIINQFHHYVTPTYHPQLTKFCTELTGITQQMVDKKLKIQEVLAEFDKWIWSQKYLHSKNFTFVTCGDWDLANCLKNEARAKNIEVPEYLKNYINIKNAFRDCLPQFHQSMGMMGMLKGLNIPHEGRHHSGIDDVRNICNIAIALMKIKGYKYTKNAIKYVK